MPISRAMSSARVHPFLRHLAGGRQLGDVAVELGRRDLSGISSISAISLTASARLALSCRKTTAPIEAFSAFCTTCGLSLMNLSVAIQARVECGGTSAPKSIRLRALLLLHHLEGQRRVEHDRRRRCPTAGSAPVRRRRAARAVNFTLRSCMVQRARMSDAEPAEVMPTFLPSSSDDLLDLGIRSSPSGTSRSSRARRRRRPWSFTPFLRPAATRAAELSCRSAAPAAMRLEGLRAAAIDRQLRLDAFLVEQLLAHRRLGDDGGIVGLGRQRRCGSSPGPGLGAGPASHRAIAAAPSAYRRAEFHCSMLSILASSRFARA